MRWHLCHHSANVAEIIIGVVVRSNFNKRAFNATLTSCGWSVPARLMAPRNTSSLCYSPLWLKTGEKAPARDVVARILIMDVVARTLITDDYVYLDSLLLYAVRSVRAQATLQGDLRLLPFVPNWLCIEMKSERSKTRNVITRKMRALACLLALPRLSHSRAEINQ